MGGDRVQEKKLLFNRRTPSEANELRQGLAGGEGQRGSQEEGGGGGNQSEGIKEKGKKQGG